MTTPMTPTHGAPMRPGRPATADVDRWLPDPSWPVPPRGWQLWAAAGAPTRTLRDESSRGGDGGTSGGDNEPGRDAEPRIVHTVPVTSEMSAFAALEEPSFTLPARPGLLAPEPVDLLADPEPRRLPEGTVSGFAVIGALVAFSCLVGGLTAGFVVIGVSTLLAAIAALVRGRVSLSSVGGQRGAALLLGAAVAALILPSVTAHERRAEPEAAGGVPVSSPFSVGTQTAYAAVPSAPESAGSVQAPAATRPAEVPASAAPSAPPAPPAPPVQAPPAVPSAVAPGLTLALDALDPRPGNAEGPGTPGQRSDDNSGKGSDNGPAKAADKASDKASKAADKAADKASKAADKASKAADKAAKKAADKTAKAARANEKAAKAALAKAAKAAAAQARQARAQAQPATQGFAPDSTSRAILGSSKKADRASGGTAVPTGQARADVMAATRLARQDAENAAKAAKTVAAKGVSATSGH